MKLLMRQNLSENLFGETKMTKEQYRANARNTYHLFLLTAESLAKRKEEKQKGVRNGKEKEKNQFSQSNTVAVEG